MKALLPFLSTLFLFIGVQSYGLAQCTLTTGDYTEAEVETCLANCSCSTIIIPDGNTVTLDGDWDLTDQGDIDIIIEGETGQLEIPGNGNGNGNGGEGPAVTLFLTENSSITIADPTNNNAITTGNSNNQPRIVVGDVEYDANDIDDVIANGGINPMLLPVSLLYFTGEIEDDLVILQWATATETNNLLFQIQRKQVGSNWQVIDEIAGAGTTQQLQEYELIDQPNGSGIFQYKLIQVDEDGTETAYPIIEINYIQNQPFILYPNPVKNELTIQSLHSSDAQYQIYSVDGKLVQSGFVQRQINVNQIPSGFYIIKIIGETNRMTSKFIKQ